MLSDFLIKHVGLSTDRREINALAQGDPAALITAGESAYASLIEEICDKIAQGGPMEYKIILLSGPSSSGKTTTAQMLAGCLGARGVPAQTVSLDDFYLERDKAPDLPDGEKDYESVGALDVDQIHKCLMDLIYAGACTIPKFSFKAGGRVGGRELRLEERGLAVVEGLHALNPLLYEPLPPGRVLRLYVSVETGVYEDEELVLSPRHLRLIRRLIRDYTFRGASPAQTLDMWNTVVRGEEDYLLPYKDTADFTLNSLHPYEPCLFRNRACVLLEQVEEDDPGYGTARYLLGALAPFAPLDAEDVPKTSLLREFLGGGIYRY